MRRRSFSTTLITSRTVRISTTEMNDVLTPTLAPGSSVRLPMNPSTGDVMTVLARLIFSSSSRALRLCHLRLRRDSSWADGRLIPRVGVVECLPRQQVALVQAARALEVVLRQLQVGLPLTNRRLRHVVGGFGLIDLLDDLAVFDLRDGLSAPHGIAELHVDRVEAALAPRHGVDGGGADEVADDHDCVESCLAASLVRARRSSADAARRRSRRRRRRSRRRPCRRRRRRPAAAAGPVLGACILRRRAGGAVAGEVVRCGSANDDEQAAG